MDVKQLLGPQKTFCPMNHNTFTLPDTLSEDAAEAARKLGMSVDEFLLQAVHSYLEKQQRKDSIFGRLFRSTYKTSNDEEQDPLECIACVSYN